MTELQFTFLQLVRLGTGLSKNIPPPNGIDWIELKNLANEQGLHALVLDGAELLLDGKPSKKVLPQWIGEVLLKESIYAKQKTTAIEMAMLFHDNGIRTYILKGLVLSECYPKPEHRYSCDYDCFLLPNDNDFDAWKLGNDLVCEKGYDVNLEHYKNSTFTLPGLTVENHQFLTPFRGNKRLGSLERYLQTMLRDDTGGDRFDGTWLYRPPVMVTALFIIEHAYSHFLHEGLTWRHILDWMLFKQKRDKEIDWISFDNLIDKYGFRKFYDSYSRLGLYLVGDIQEFSLCVQDRLMLEDVWAPLDLHETVRGFKGKLALAGNTWRARWKYRYFTDMTWTKALWIQVKGFLFMKNPKLS